MSSRDKVTQNIINEMQHCFQCLQFCQLRITVYLQEVSQVHALQLGGKEEKSYYPYKSRTQIISDLSLSICAPKSK